jgi:hypothetical protein
MPRRFGRNAPPHERLPVAWYAPPVLLQAGEELVQSQAFQRNYDRRESFSDALAPIDLSQREGELWLDFISDTGDGGRATFAVARAALAAELTVSDEQGAPLALPEADVLLLGGDLAYPGASPAVYQYRFFEPFTMALDPASRFGRPNGPRKVVAAIPQNHDWFDSAATFCRYFVAKDKGDFLGARTPQRQTYFALKLPRGYWVLGFDWALTGDLDRQQFEAFAGLLDAGREDGIAPGDQLILLYPEPYWTRPLGDGAPEGYPRRYQRLEAQLEAHGAAIRLRLAGDLHHYVRETLPAAAGHGESHLVTCGTAGAFLHPTHGVEVSAPKHIDRKPEAGAIDEELRRRLRVGRVGRAGPASAPTAGAAFEPRCHRQRPRARWPGATCGRCSLCASRERRGARAGPTRCAISGTATSPSRWPSACSTASTPTSTRSSSRARSSPTVSRRWSASASTKARAIGCGRWSSARWPPASTWPCWPAACASPGKARRTGAAASSAAWRMVWRTVC